MAYHINVSAIPKPVYELYRFAEARIVDLSDISEFKDITPTLDAMSADIGAMTRAEAVYRKDTSSETAKEARDNSVNKVTGNLKSWIQQIEEIAGDNLVLISSTGFSLESTRVAAVAPQGITPTPKVRPTVNPYEVWLSVEPYKQNKARVFYNWEMSTDGIVYYPLKAAGGGSRRKVSGLELNKKYWFRVSYATTAGSNTPSEAVDITLSMALTQYGHKSSTKKGKAKQVPNDTPPAPSARSSKSAQTKPSDKTGGKS